jgi:hypothetical protein
MTLRLSPSPRAPDSSHARIACCDECDLLFEGASRPGTVWDISVLGAYVVVSDPVPPVDSQIQLTISRLGEVTPAVITGRVRWVNGPSIFPGCGRTKATLPPGCGVEFLHLDGSLREWIAVRVRSLELTRSLTSRWRI